MKDATDPREVLLQELDHSSDSASSSSDSGSSAQEQSDEGDDLPLPFVKRFDSTRSNASWSKLKLHVPDRQDPTRTACKLLGLDNSSLTPIGLPGHESVRKVSSRQA